MQAGQSVKCSAIVFAAVLYLAAVCAVRGDWPYQDKLTASDGAGGDYFGKSVSVTTDYCIVGAWGNDDKGTLSGSAYIFSRSGTNWNQSSKLVASDGASYDNFGCSVGISGKFSIVGAEKNDAQGANSGQAYIFEYGIEQAKLAPSDGVSYDYFGCAVAIDGNYAIAGAYGDNSTAGSAYIFFYNAGAWTQQDKLTASDGLGGDKFGSSVAIDSNYCIAGAPYDDCPVADSGSAYIFKRNVSTWSQQAKLVPSDWADHDTFGASVSISGDYAIAGAANNDNANGTEAGAAYIFKRDANSWTQQAKLTASDGDGYEHFGCSVAIDGNYAIVGAYRAGGFDEKGAAYIFKRDGTTWSEQIKLTAFDAYKGDQYGIAVAISGYHVLVGAHWDDDKGAASGSAYMYRQLGSATLLSPNGSEKWLADTTRKITWQRGAADNVLLEYTIDPGSIWNTITTIADNGSYPWLIPKTNSKQCLVRITDVDYPAVSDSSDNLFEVYTGTVKLLTPNGGQSLHYGINYDITWQTIDGNIADVTLEYSTNNGVGWTAIDTVSNTGLYHWLIPDCNSSSCLVRVSDAAYPTVADESNDVFEIYTASLDVLSPNGGETLFSNETCEIQWQSTGVAGNVKLEYSVNDGSDWIQIETVPNTGSYQWIVPYINSEQCLVRIAEADYLFVADVSNSLFEICTGSLTVDDPNGGERLPVGLVYEILWQSRGDINEVLIEYSVNNGADFSDVNTAANTGSYQWLVPRQESEQCLIRITNTADANITDTSNSVFEMFVCNLTADFDGDCLVDFFDLDVLTDNWLVSDSNGWFGQTELNGDGEPNDSFGISVGISGNFAIVGAYQDSAVGPKSGAAYIFEYIDANWAEHSKLTASDGAAYDYFGGAVAVDGNYAIAGADEDDDIEDRSGSAYIFHFNDVNWTQQAKLNASSPGARDYFGNSVSIDDDYAIVGAWGDDSWTGSAYVFKRNGQSWTRQAKLIASDRQVGDSFGVSVSISGDYAIIGSYYDDETGDYSGSAYIFKRVDTNWTEYDKLSASDGAPYDYFGASVSVDGDYCVVSATGDDDNGDSSGSAYIFKRVDAIWVQQAKLTASDGQEWDEFGASVSISGDYCIIGARGDDDECDNCGSAYIFQRQGTIWSEQTKLTFANGMDYDFFGGSVSIDDKRAIVGWYDDIFGDKSGPVSIFKKMCSQADLNDDCATDFEDFAILAEQWLQ